MTRHKKGYPRFLDELFANILVMANCCTGQLYNAFLGFYIIGYLKIGQNDGSCFGGYYISLCGNISSSLCKMNQYKQYHYYLFFKEWCFSGNKEGSEIKLDSFRKSKQ